MKISDMKVGNIITSRLYLADASLRKTKSNPPSDFLSMTFVDDTDSIDAKIWNYRASLGIPAVNKVYDVTGSVGEFSGRKQITVTKMPVSEDQSLIDFSCTFYKDTNTLWNKLSEAIESIEHPGLHNITKYIYTTYKDDILNSSSAKAVHHVGIGGNCVHTLETYAHAVHIATQLRSENIPVSLDLVKAGALLHDIGKLSTYKITGPVVDMTLDGMLQDHIALGISLLDDTSTAFDNNTYSEYFRLLKHIIAAHHGKLEYGSPVMPVFMEAYIVNMADGISANIEILNMANKKAEAEGKPLTDKIFALSNKEHILQSTVAEMLS